jgi:predicted phosphodiesterase
MSPWSFVLTASDWQVGKDRPGGWQATAERWQVAVERMTERVKMLSKTMGKPERIVLLGMGDLGEGCKGHYAMQTYSVVLNQAEQFDAVRDMLRHSIEQARKLAPVDVYAVGGNHGEERNDSGKAYTDFADNRDVSVFRTLAWHYGHLGVDDVRFSLPKSSLTQTIDLHGVLVGIAHGHQFSGGVNALVSAEKWWKGQMAGKFPIGHADLLVAGHRHHLIVSEAMGARTFMQCPALDGGSEWYTNLTGASSRDGVLSFVVSPGGWSDLAVL